MRPAGSLHACFALAFALFQAGVHAQELPSDEAGPFVPWAMPERELGWTREGTAFVFEQETVLREEGSMTATPAQRAVVATLVVVPGGERRRFLTDVSRRLPLSPEKDVLREVSVDDTTEGWSRWGRTHPLFLSPSSREGPNGLSVTVEPGRALVARVPRQRASDVEPCRGGAEPAAGEWNEGVYRRTRVVHSLRSGTDDCPGEQVSEFLVRLEREGKTLSSIAVQDELNPLAGPHPFEIRVRWAPTGSRAAIAIGHGRTDSANGFVDLGWTEFAFLEAAPLPVELVCEEGAPSARSLARWRAALERMGFRLGTSRKGQGRHAGPTVFFAPGRTFHARALTVLFPGTAHVRPLDWKASAPLVLAVPSCEDAQTQLP